MASDSNIKNYKTAIFAGGCFWCMVSPFDILDGIISVTSGYIGGNSENPTYKDVKSQETGHYEAIKVIYDDTIMTYDKLLDAFWRQIDPTDDEGQFQDRGPSYISAIFYGNEEEKSKAQMSKQKLNSSGRFPLPVVTRILPATTFYTAEEYHQNFYKTNPVEYKNDRNKSGRDEFINKYWGEDFFKIYEE
ncbi:peptide-methionine (S)-S-oxide reductase MsrA [Clostridium sp.]|uniref:peptide-methionine (S)-S-oxide reductase MsrA n=1 Tax=Clostridium sp. TaxID=1506 RepID=UPI003216F9C8